MKGLEIMNEKMNELLEQIGMTYLTEKDFKEWSEEEKLSVQILRLQLMDIEEFNNQVKKKSYHLSRFIKNEMVIRSAQVGCAKTSFKVTSKAVRALIGLGFIIEDGSLTFSFKPLDRHTYAVTFKLHSEKMRNAQIHWYNSTFDLNIPLNKEIEIFPDDEQFDFGFQSTQIVKIQRG